MNIIAPSLLYHDIIDSERFEDSGFNSPDADIYKIKKEVFRKQLSLINDRFPLIETRLPDNLNLSEQNRHYLLFTFDDGGKSAITYTATLLEYFGWVGYFFITTNKIGGDGFLSAEDIQELHGRGHFIGSHSHTHPDNISVLSEPDILQEWETSCLILRDIIGKDIIYASIPGGFYSKKVESLAARSGIQYLFTSEPIKTIKSGNSVHLIGRYAINRSTKNRSVVELASVKSNQHQIFQALYWNLKKIFKLLLGEVYIKIRRIILK